MFEDFILELIKTHRQREDLLNAHTALTLQMRASCRRAVGFNNYELDAKLKARKKAEADALFDAACDMLMPARKTKDGGGDHSRIDAQMACESAPIHPSDGRGDQPRCDDRCRPESPSVTLPDERRDHDPVGAHSRTEPPLITPSDALRDHTGCEPHIACEPQRIDPLDDVVDLPVRDPHRETESAVVIPIDGGGDHIVHDARTEFESVPIDPILVMSHLTAIEPLFMARALVHKAILPVEAKMRGMAEQLPVWKTWGANVRGLGSLSLAQIIGEAGDLSKYANPAKLWKRMGLAVLNGERQGRRSDPREAKAHGYSPKRRSKVFVIGDNLLRAGSPYRAFYDQRKADEIRKATDEGREVLPAAKIATRVKKGASADAFRSEKHVHLRAKRFMEKRLLLDLWTAWNQ